MKQYLTFLTIILVLGGCSSSGPLQKRKYSKGYYFSGKSTVKHNETVSNDTEKKSSKIEDSEDIKVNSKPLVYADKSNKLVNNNSTLLSTFQSVTHKTKSVLFPSLLSQNEALLTRIELDESITKMPSDTIKDVYAQDKVKYLPLHNASKAGLVIFWIGIGLIIFAGFGLFVLLLGYFISMHGLGKSEQNPELYNVERAERIIKGYNIVAITMLVIAAIAAIILIGLFVIWLSQL